ncbi:metallophosphoesterase [Treponema rectale]|uniref:Icc-related predicted phosphoesterase n=1 Tax=Treponema rectale TaxID=744512 RepID=A0A840SBM6_9SPIR|nr:metallophosphoesterase [Treponema rectale]MBB5218120.1 Icc-related predicted phosphoesterase [Treponema rectale]QOS40170.1 metallophosphoesterase [Treponema rectale]
MKFLCVSDQIDPLVYSTTLKERYGDVDAVFCAGDLSLEYVDFIVTALGKPTFFVFGNHNLEDYDLYTKSDHNNSMTPFQQASRGHGGDHSGQKVFASKHLFFTDSSGKKTPLLIAGADGSMRYNNGKCQFTEGQMFRTLLKMVPKLLWNKIRYGRYLDVFLTHASPRHIHDREDPCHKGFECFNWFIRKFSPALMIHGHIHLYDLQAVRCTKTEKTTVVNAYSHIVVEMKKNFTKGAAHESDISIISDR